MNPPEGMSGGPDRGKPPLGSTAFHPLWRDGFREGARREVTSTLSLAPVCFTVVASFSEVCKSALGCLTYSRIWCLSRNKHHTLWPESGKGTELGKKPGFKVSRFHGFTAMRRCWPSENLETWPQAVALAWSSGEARGTGRGKLPGAPWPSTENSGTGARGT